MTQKDLIDEHGFVVTDNCIERNRQVVREGIYIVEVVLTKEALIEAYNRWVKGVKE